MEEVTEYPKMLYRDGSAFDWEGKAVDYRTVSDAAEEDAAVTDGWRHGREAEDAPKRGRKPKVDAVSVDAPEDAQV